VQDKKDKRRKENWQKGYKRKENWRNETNKIVKQERNGELQNISERKL
jgi:hypothetical protein